MPPPTQTPQAQPASTPAPSTPAPQQPAPSAAGRGAVADRNAGQVGAALGVAPEPLPAKIKRLVQADRDTVVNGVIKEARDGYKLKLDAELKKKFGAKSASVAAKAKADTEATMTPAVGAPPDQAMGDVKAHADEHAAEGASTAVTSVATKVSGEVTEAIGFQDAIAMGHFKYDNMTVGEGVKLDKLDKEKVRLKSEAKRAMEPLIAAKITAAKIALDAKLATNQFDAQLNTAASTKAAAGAQTELTKRKEVPNNDAVLLIANKAADEAINSTEASLKTYLEDKIGAKGAGFTRSKELRGFRGGLKEAASEQAHQDVDAEMAKPKPPGTAPTPAADHYKRMVARGDSYKGAKGVVDEHLKGLADEKATALVGGTKAGEKAKLSQIASTEAWDILRGGINPKSELAATKAATKAIQPEAAAYLALLQKDAQSWKDLVLGKEAKEGATPQDAATLPTAATEKAKVKEKVSKPDAAGKTLASKTVEAANGEVALGMIGGIVDLAAPQVDTACSLEIAFKVPLTHGGFAEFGVKGEAEKSDKGTKIAAALKLGAGWETYGFAIAGHLEVFIEAAGPTTTDAVLLMQYGIYRRLADKSAGLAGIFAGKRRSEKETGMSRAEQNETWAAMVEERSLKTDDHFVNSGVGGDVGLKFDLGLAKGDASVAHRTGTRIDKDSLGAAAGKLDHTGDGAARTRAAELAAADKKKGKSSNKTTVALNGEFNAVNSMKIAFGGQFIRESSQKAVTAASAHPEVEETYDTELSFKVPYDLGGVAPPQLANIVVGNFVPAGLSLVKSAYERLKTKPSTTPKPTKTETAGTAIQAADDASNGLDAAFSLARGNIMDGMVGHMATATPFGAFNPETDMGDQVGHTAAGFIGTDSASSTANALGSTSSLEVTLGIKREAGQWLPHVGFSAVKKMEVAVGGFGAGMKIDVERKKKLLSYEKEKTAVAPVHTPPVTPAPTVGPQPPGPHVAPHPPTTAPPTAAPVAPTVVPAPQHQP